MNLLVGIFQGVQFLALQGIIMMITFWIAFEFLNKRNFLGILFGIGGAIYFIIDTLCQVHTISPYPLGISIMIYYFVIGIYLLIISRKRK